MNIFGHIVDGTFGRHYCRRNGQKFLSPKWLVTKRPCPLIKQTLGSLDLPSMLEPRGLYRTDGKRSDGVTMIPWEMGKQLVWDVTVVGAVAPSRLNQGSLCNPGTGGCK